MNKQTVIASKYRLTSRVTKDGAVIYDVNGSKELLFEDRVVKMDTVNRDNNQNRGHGRILWVINEEKTEAIDDMREEKRLKLEAQSMAANATNDGLAAAILKQALGQGQPEKPKTKVKKAKEEALEEDTSELDSLSVEELKALCDEKDIEYHHKAGKGKLIELLS